ncbi:MAG: DNA mismatch repair endonuclease MutL [Prevotella sp.]|nr:DNA mismatch repair endonuclease MutL [Prevotella sp.]
MSDVIQLLPDSVANQIAAGEVIQRPASVVKELVENAVDAGAKNIHVSVIDAGRTTIQVVDDGVGMSGTDARLAFERHATSKIRQADDLFALRTMGFRGEALPSIAAVAQVELRTRRAEDELGTLLNISGSRFLGQEPVATPQGSNFKVENLFFNVPARRKFLKSNATELSNVLMAYERIVLVNPDISFTLHSNNSELMNLPATGLRQRIVDVFGKRTNQELLPVEVETDMCRIYGYVGKPEAARKKGAQQFFFVNGRYMRHPYFNKAIQTVFERIVPQGEQVPYFIYFEVEPADIDVNIHPTKTEIKFENEQAIWQILSAAIRDAVGRFNEVPTIDFDTIGRPDIPVYHEQGGTTKMPNVNVNPSYNPFSGTNSSYSQTRLSHKKDIPEQWEQLFPEMEERKQDLSLFEQPGNEGDVLSDKSTNHYQYKGRYIMTAVKSGLMVIDQHRAHLRILYEEYMDRTRHHHWTTQKLLFPEQLSLSAADRVALHAVELELRNLGFDFNDSDEGVVLRGIPAGIDDVAPDTLMTDVLVQAASLEHGATERMQETLVLGMARSAAIPYGQVLSNDEMDHLVNGLLKCADVNLTPDGKSIHFVLQQQEIEKMLG